MLYGLQAAKDIKLSCIGRELEEDIPLKKTEERLSRNLLREGLDEGIFRAIAKEGAKRIHKDTLLLVDPTDIRKLYARKMPYLATIMSCDLLCALSATVRCVGETSRLLPKSSRRNAGCAMPKQSGGRPKREKNVTISSTA